MPRSQLSQYDCHYDSSDFQQLQLLSSRLTILASAGRAHNSFFHDFSSCWNLKTLTAEMYQNRLFQPQLQQDSAGFCRIEQIPAWHPPRAAPNALPAGLPSSQRYAPQRLPIGSCPTYGGQAAVQPGSDPQASPSATCQGAARKGWKSA